MTLFDTHTHMSDERYEGDRESIMASLPSFGIKYIVDCATNSEDIEFCMNLAKEYDYVYAALGVHPHHADEFSRETIYKLREYAKNKKVVAIGEIGLDYHYDTHPRALQKQVFGEQLELATELTLPAVLHSRESTADMIDVLKAHPGTFGVMHCFSSSVETCKIILDMGLYIGLGGTLTFKNSKKAVEVCKYAPMDRILVETDCPYLSPVPMRGKTNFPHYTQYVVEKIAEIKGIDAKEVENITLENAKELFKIG